jgi:hypothetical protein
MMGDKTIFILCQRPTLICSGCACHPPTLVLSLAHPDFMRYDNEIMRSIAFIGYTLSTRNTCLQKYVFLFPLVSQVEGSENIDQEANSLQES